MFLIFAVLENGQTEKYAKRGNLRPILDFFFYITHMHGVPNRSYAYAVCLLIPYCLAELVAVRRCVSVMNLSV